MYRLHKSLVQTTPHRSIGNLLSTPRRCSDHHSRDDSHPSSPSTPRDPAPHRPEPRPQTKRRMVRHGETQPLEPSINGFPFRVQNHHPRQFGLPGGFGSTNAEKPTPKSSVGRALRLRDQSARDRGSLATENLTRTTSDANSPPPRHPPPDRTRGCALDAPPDNHTVPAGTTGAIDIAAVSFGTPSSPRCDLVPGPHLKVQAAPRWMGWNKANPGIPLIDSMRPVHAVHSCSLSRTTTVNRVTHCIHRPPFSGSPTDPL